MTYTFDLRVILKGEIRSQLLLGVKKLRSHSSKENINPENYLRCISWEFFYSLKLASVSSRKESLHHTSHCDTAFTDRRLVLGFCKLLLISPPSSPPPFQLQYAEVQKPPPVIGPSTCQHKRIIF